MAVVINGTTGITSVNGSAAAPSVTGTDTDTGIVYGTNTLSLATGGTTAVTVDSSQNVGIGTSSPVGTLQVLGAATTDGSISYNIHTTASTAYNSSPASGNLVSLKYTSGGAYAGMGGWTVAKENATDGNYASYFAIHTRPAGGANTERARIDSSGNLLLNGTTNRASNGGMTITNDGTNLYLGPKNYGAGQEGGEIAFGRGTDGVGAWTFDVLSGASPNIRLINGSAAGVQVVNGATSWSAYSDIRLKTNITPLRSVVQDIQGIECINYHLDGIDTEETPIRIGVSAQSLVGKFDEVLDETEVKNKDGLYYSVRYSDMVPYLIKAIQEQQAIIEQLKSDVAALKAKA